MSIMQKIVCGLCVLCMISLWGIVVYIALNSGGV